MLSLCPQITDNCESFPCENNGTCIPVNATTPGDVSFVPSVTIFLSDQTCHCCNLYTKTERLVHVVKI